MATEQQTLKLAGMIVEHAEVLGLLSKKAQQWAIQNPQQAMATIVNAIAARPEASTELLIDKPPQKSWCSVNCPGNFDGPFFFSDPRFWMSQGFTRLFLGRVKAEKGYTFTIKFITEECSDSRLLQNVLSLKKEKADVIPSIGHVAALVRNQLDGICVGPLLMDHRPNVFFIPDVNGEYKTLYIRYGSGWRFDARNVRSDLVWPPGTKVFF